MTEYPYTQEVKTTFSTAYVNWQYLVKKCKKKTLLKRISLVKTFWKDINGLDLEFRFGEYRVPKRCEARSNFCVCLWSEAPGPDLQWNSHLPLILLRILTARYTSEIRPLCHKLGTQHYCFKTEAFKCSTSLVPLYFSGHQKNSEKSRFWWKGLSWQVHCHLFLITLGTEPQSERLCLWPWIPWLPLWSGGVTVGWYKSWKYPFTEEAD